MATIDLAAVLASTGKLVGLLAVLLVLVPATLFPLFEPATDRTRRSPSPAVPR